MVFRASCPHMKTYTLTIIVSLAGFCILPSCSTQPQSETLKVSATFSSDTSLSGRIHQEVNNYRLGKGRNALPRHAGLDRLAQQHCVFLSQNRGKFGLYGKTVSHYGFEGRALIARQKFQMANVSENVAATSSGSKGSASTFVRLWTNSKGHEHNMRDKWDYTGVGSVTLADGTTIATQLFATYNPSQMMISERFRQF